VSRDADPRSLVVPIRVAAASGAAAVSRAARSGAASPCLARLPSAALALVALVAGCGGDGAPPDAALPRYDGAVCAPPVALPADDRAALRAACTFSAGATPLETLGLDEGARRAIPLTHVIVLMQENRSFDHYFATLSRTHPEVEALPDDYTNPDRDGLPVRPFHLDGTCVEADPPHQWDAMHAGWNGGRMDGFVRSAAVLGSDGRYALGYFDENDLPFYHWLARRFAFADRHFASVLGGTWANRLTMYTGSTHGVRNTFDRVVTEARTLFDALDEAGVRWGVYSDGPPRTDCLGWTTASRGVGTYTQFRRALLDGTLPQVAFLDPGPGMDEGPPRDVQLGEQWTRDVVEAAIRSPLWPTLALILTYDEAGGFFDHVPPPAACPPSRDLPELDRLGMRVPLYVVSPWARPGYVSHVVHEHASITRFIEALHGLGALTVRDANADALLDMFDFTACASIDVPEIPPAGIGGCRAPGRPLTAPRRPAPRPRARPRRAGRRHSSPLRPRARASCGRDRRAAPPFVSIGVAEV
jgi:phospholipase C